VRKSLFGKLGEIQHEHKLGAGWAESFFLQDSAEELSLNQLDKKADLAAQEAALLSELSERDGDPGP
jgi:hypothetical protein